jgi:hypothetical protein
MSKMDGLRAMREARYAEAAARTTQPAASRPRLRIPNDAPAAGPTVTPAASGPVEPEAEAALCGHRAISGRTCTREAGHAAKSHRYA